MSSNLSTEQMTLVEVRLNNERKSVVVAYLLLLFVGVLGSHNFYVGRTGAGIAQLILFILFLLTFFIYIGYVFFIFLLIWLFVDLFTIPGFMQAQLEKRRSELLMSMAMSSAVSE